VAEKVLKTSFKMIPAKIIPRKRWHRIPLKGTPLNKIRWRAVLSHATAEGAMTRSKTTIIKVPKTKTAKKRMFNTSNGHFFWKNGSVWAYISRFLNDRNDETLMYIN